MNRRSGPSHPVRELSLPEMLDDPVVQAVMDRDGVGAEQIRGLLATVRKNIMTWDRTACAACWQKLGMTAPDGETYHRIEEGSLERRF